MAAPNLSAQQDALVPAIPLHLKLAAGTMVATCLNVVVTLGVPDLLKDGPARSSDELAKQCGANADRLYRVMRALTNEGVFVEHEGKKFTLGEQGQYFRVDHPMSAAATTKWLAGPLHSKAWLHLLHAVKTGEPAAHVAYGGDAFEYFSSDPAYMKIFQDCMTELTRTTVPPVIAAYKEEWSKFKTICDVGGGHGHLLAEILKAAGGNSTGILHDLPAVIAGANPVLDRAGVAGSVRCEGGDFFKSVPKNVDLYVMKHIIHDHDDERCIKILKNCREGLNPGGRVLILEEIIPGPNIESFAKLIDVEMFTMVTGRERNEAEFASLLKAAGLRFNRVVPVRGPIQIIEAESESSAVASRG